MNTVHEFRQKIQKDYRDFLERQSRRFHREETLKIDLHCHDRNSDVTDELWGRILRIPETWLPSEDLVHTLKHNGADAITITNHNNARSCWEMMEKGEDILPGAEFTCTFQDLDIKIHLLTYGFTPQQEEKLKVLRKDIYQFAAYCNENDLVTVLPHPLYFYNPNKQPTMELFEKFMLLFERFEVMNGQRDTWQNILTLAWLESMTEEKIEQYSKKHKIDPKDFCRNPYHKRLTGGSDDHMGLFAGSCGTLLHVPKLAERRKTEKLSALALEALRDGHMAPYGHLAEEEKLNIAFLDFFAQVALNMEDPGLIRMFLHHGTLRDKMMCLMIANGFQELKRHRYTLKFFKTFHEALQGKKPGLLTSWKVSKEFKPVVQHLHHVATTRKKRPEQFLDTLNESIPSIYKQMKQLLVDRVGEKVQNYFSREDALQALTPGEVIKRSEVPSHLRSLFSGEKPKSKDISAFDLGKALDSLSFPLLASGLLVGSNFTATKVLYNNRRFLSNFADGLGKYRHPERVLWLTDTLYDRNGVSSVLQATLKEVRERDLPIDFLVCDPERESGDHLQVVRPLATFNVPQFGDQVLRVPDILDIQKVFLEGGYDRIICSTELIMGAAALYLKSAFSVKAYFYMHTDWLDFFEKNTNLESHALDRVRRALRAFYKRYNGIFVLNQTHHDWLVGKGMDLPQDKVFKTAHWVEDHFKPIQSDKTTLYPSVKADERVLLFTGRLSDEKGVMDIPGVYEKVRQEVGKVRLVFAGTGPAEARLRQAVPDAVFLGWVDYQKLPEYYANADLLLLPSRFDTFGCVVIEAMNCGTPVAAYNTKGPRDIINHGINGMLCEDADDMAYQVIAYLKDPVMQRALHNGALVRGGDYQARDIMDAMLRDIEMERDEQGKLYIKVSTRVTEFTEDLREEGGLINELLEIVS